VEPEIPAELEESLALEPVFKESDAKERDEAPLEPEDTSHAVSVVVVVVVNQVSVKVLVTV